MSLGLLRLISPFINNFVISNCYLKNIFSKQNRHKSNLLIINPVIWKEQVLMVVGAASSRDHIISRLEAAPTGGFLW
jgi:hypothetical protein